MSDAITDTQAKPWAGRFSNPIVGRRFAIADVHGCLNTLRRMVEDILKLGEDDVLYLLGDYIDRGPDSKGVLDYLMQLCMSDLDIRPLLGNHERMLLNAVTRTEEARNRWFDCDGRLTMQQFGVKKPSDIPEEYINFLSTLPTVLTTDDYVFVHAGLHFGVADPVNDTPDFFRLWDRDYKVKPELIGNRTLVVGHTVTDIHTIRKSLETKHIMLDNGCFKKGYIGFGSLVALNLDTRNIIEIKNCE